MLQQDLVPNLFISSHHDRVHHSSCALITLHAHSSRQRAAAHDGVALFTAATFSPQKQAYRIGQW
jgi:hypothetical protein